MNKTRKSAELILVRKPISELLPHPKNARQHDDRQIGKLRHSIKTHGFAKGSVVVQKSTGYILAGHGIVEALRKESYDSVDVIEVDLPDDKALAFLIADNHIAEQSTWDDIGLQNLINELSDLNVPALDFGFDDDDLQALADRILEGTGGGGEVAEDDFDTEQAIEPISKAGDLWILGNKHRVLCGDSTNKDDVARLMGGEKADMVFTDPPYGVSIGAKNQFLNSFQPSGRNLTPIENDSLDEESLYNLLKSAFINCKNNMNDKACFYVTAPQGGSLGLMMMMMRDSGLPVRHVLNWIKSSPTFSMGRLDYDYQHEPILYGWIKSHEFYGKGEHTKSAWFIDKPREAKEHPTMKPIALVSNALLNSSLENQTILDLFLGSGTTLIACEQLGRVCVGIEIDPHYTDVIVKRYIDFKHSADDVFVERNGVKMGYSELPESTGISGK